MISFCKEFRTEKRYSIRAFNLKPINQIEKENEDIGEEGTYIQIAAQMAKLHSLTGIPKSTNYEKDFEKLWNTNRVVAHLNQQDFAAAFSDVSSALEISLAYLQEGNVKNKYIGALFAHKKC